MTLAAHYSRFRVGERLLFTGHSHQAWPDVAFAAQQEAIEDAARWVDDKWARAFEKAAAVRAGFARLLGDTTGHIALTQNTHDAVVRFLSALPLRARPRVVTTDQEFHTLRRQLTRLGEEGVHIVSVPAAPAETLVERMAGEVNDRTAAVFVSTVSFMTAHIVPGLRGLHEVCVREGAELFLDTYHQLNVVPFSMLGLERAFVTGGGYKYCQLGEGNCFLRFPRDCEMRPMITGWFAEFGLLASASQGVAYGDGPERFAGSTYDPTSHYRAAAVLAFFAEQQLTAETLRAISRRQIGRMADRLSMHIDAGRTAGFLALHTPRASEIVTKLKDLGVHTDSRGDVLRLGPAPYITDAQIDEAMAHVKALL